MAISGDYTTPVYVNGFQCKNCTDVDNAKKYIDPAHPQSGPFGVNARTDPTQSAAVKYGGALSNVSTAPGAAAVQSPQAEAGVGGTLNISV